MPHFLEPLEVFPSDLADIAIVSLLLWLGITWLRTTRVRSAALGFALLGALYVLVALLELQLTVWILQAFSAVLAFVLVVVFQDDLRRLFEWIGVFGLARRSPRLQEGCAGTVARVVFDLAERSVGALLVFPGREPLERHLDGGVPLHGRTSEPLMRSLFDPRSPGHDGAIVFRGDMIERFGAHLPLSKRCDLLRNRGTRHAAALGLAERSDALCIAVSEERGAVSVAHAGELREIADAAELVEELQRVGASAGPGHRGSWIRGPLWRIASRWPEGGASIVAATLLWVAFVPGSSIDQLSRPVPIEIANMPAGYEVTAVEPAAVDVTFEGRRRDVYLVNPAKLHVKLDAILVQLGRRTFQLSTDQVEAPDGLAVVGVEPRKVRLSVRRIDATQAAPTG